jgi:L-lactate dehydrogenase complex protein LldG
VAENTTENKVYLSVSLQDSPFSSLQSADTEEMSSIHIGISTCELLVAQTGTALVTSKEGRRIIGLSPIHIIIAERSQLRRTLDEGLKELAAKYGQDLPSQVTLITGPSRTADIEKTLILGAHGPKKLAVFIY